MLGDCPNWGDPIDAEARGHPWNALHGGNDRRTVDARRIRKNDQMTKLPGDVGQVYRPCGVGDDRAAPAAEVDDTFASQRAKGP